MKATENVITTVEALEQLNDDWSALFTRCPDATVFQSPQWMLPWIKRFAPHCLRSLTLRDNGMLVGLGLMFVWCNERRERELLPAGISHSDYCDALVTPTHEQCWTDAFNDFLRTTANDWNVCRFEQLPSTSLLLNTAASARQSRTEPCLVLALPKDITDVRQALPKQLRQNVSYYQHRAEKAGRVEYQMADETNAPQLLETFFRLHRARWQREGCTGAIANEEIESFHRKVAQRFVAADMLRLHALKLNGETIAAAYCFRDKRRTYLYLTGYDPAFQHLSPGTLIIARAVEQAVKDCSTEFDFLRGREPYKYLWGAKERPTFGLNYQSTHAELPLATIK